MRGSHMNLHQIKVLIIEDDEFVAKALQKILQSRTEVEYIVDAVFTLTDAELLLKAEKYDSVLLDLELSDAKGVDCVSRVISADPDVCIVVLTGTYNSSIEHLVKQAGANEFLLKPPTASDVSKKLQYVVIHRNMKQKKLEISSALNNLSEAVSNTIKSIASKAQES